jgi:hypothetical protein
MAAMLTKAQLEQLLDLLGLKVDGMHEGAGAFRDLEIGCGASSELLRGLSMILHALGHEAALTHVTNTEHPEYGTPYLSVKSFWWKDEKGGA